MHEIKLFPDLSACRPINLSRQVYRLCSAIVILSLLPACAQKTPQAKDITNVVASEPDTAILSKDQHAWWSIKFQLPWQPGTEPRWYLSTWIAGEILAPVLTQYAVNIKLWRVHRRAVKDASGYTFSFMFYTSAQVAEKIYIAINTHALLKELKQKELLKQIVLDDLQHNDKPNIEDTSDKAWPDSIRKAWPYFIMGASQMWLELIRDLQTEAAQSNSEPEKKYQYMQDKITTLWRKNGQHAWLHHLSGLYGYSPLEIEY